MKHDHAHRELPLRSASRRLSRGADPGVGLPLPGCQKRSGSAFASQARWPEGDVELQGASRTWVRVADSGRHATYLFCETCGSTVAYTIEDWLGVIAVPVGAFADPDFPPPKFSVYEHRRHAWAVIAGDEVAHSASPHSVPPRLAR